MKKLFKLILLEASFLKKTLIVISIVLTAFTAALLAVLSVMLDTPEGMFVGINIHKKSHYNSSGGEYFAVKVHDVSFEDAEQYGAELLYANISGLTCDAELVSENGVFVTDEVSMLGDVTYTVEYHGYAVTMDGAQLLKQVVGMDGEVSSNGIFLSKACAKQLQVSVGDTVVVDGAEYHVDAIYSRGIFSDNIEEIDVVFPKGYFFVVQSSSVTCNDVYLSSHLSQEIHAIRSNLHRRGVQTEIAPRLEEVFENIALVETFYGCLAILLAVLVLYIMYALFALFYRERKAQICRFKLLGATDGTIAGIYCAIAVAIIVLAVVVATVLSVFMSKYFLGVCDEIFTATYVYHFRAWLPFAVFAVLVAIAVAMFALMGRKISCAPVVEEVRCE